MDCDYRICALAFYATTYFNVFAQGEHGILKTAPIIIAAVVIGAAITLIRLTGSGMYDYDALNSLARNAGFSASESVTMAAIALAESSGNSRAYNPELAAGDAPGKGSYGLWQINLQAHPEFTGADLYDPEVNSRAAFSIYKAAGYSFRPWATFTSGSYGQYLPGAQDA